MARGNATTSWRNKTTRGQHNERMGRGDATTNDDDKEVVGIVVDNDGNVEDTDDEGDDDFSSSVLFSTMKLHIKGSAIL